MRSKLALGATSLLGSLAVVALCLGGVSACTFSEGHESIDLVAQDFAAREGSMKAGEKAFFAIDGGPVDIFIFNEQQYYSYCQIGKVREGWSGAAAYMSLGTSSDEFIFAAPAEGNYFLVLDNTVAGDDPGDLDKSVALDVTYPFGKADNKPIGLTFPLMIAGMVGMALVVATVMSRK